MTETLPVPTFGDQRAMLIDYNDVHRATLLGKLEGLRDQQLPTNHEETARHLGHADVVRQFIDGATGVGAKHERRRQDAQT